MPSTPPRAEPLLEAATDDLTARERRRPPSVQAQDSDDTLDGSEQELPYSLSNECRYFLSKGVPLGVSAAAEWGAPPLIGMMFAGHTPESATLQSAIGFGRLYFNVSILMIMLGLCSYLQSVIPGAIGAGRKDRIPMYLARSLALSMLCLLPSFLLSLCSDVVLQAVGVPPSIAAEVGVYTRLMLPNAVLILLDIHIETVFMNLGFAKCCSINSVLTGLGVDVAVTYLFVYRWRWGVRGVALAQLAVRLSRIVVFGVLIAWNGLGRTFFGEAAFRRTAAARAAAGAAGAPTPPLRCSVERGGEEAVAPPATTKRRRERLCDPKEARIFASLGAPGIGSNLSGWLIFELQILALANIHVRRSWSLPLSSRLADPPRLRRRTRSHTNRLRSRRPPPAARRPPNPLLLTRAHAAAPMLAQGIPPAALAAGAVWIQCEQCIAAVQTGWIQVVQIRTLALMGRSDPGAPRAYALMCLLGSLCVACVSVAIGVSIGPLSRLLSHDRDTQLWLRRILWVLVPHNQTRAPNRNLEPQSTTSHSGPPRPDSICRRPSRPGAPPPPPSLPSRPRVHHRQLSVRAARQEPARDRLAAGRLLRHRDARRRRRRAHRRRHHLGAAQDGPLRRRHHHRAAARRALWLRVQRAHGLASRGPHHQAARQQRQACDAARRAVVRGQRRRWRRRRQRPRDAPQRPLATPVLWRGRRRGRRRCDQHDHLYLAFAN